MRGTAGNGKRGESVGLVMGEKELEGVRVDANRSSLGRGHGQTLVARWCRRRGFRLRERRELGVGGQTEEDVDGRLQDGIVY